MTGAVLAPEFNAAFNAVSALWNLYGSCLRGGVRAAGDVSSLSWKMDTYSSLTKQLKGSGLQAHHIIEKRLADTLGLSSKQMQSVALTPQQHQYFTNAWRAQIPYGTDYNLLSKSQIWDAAQIVYEGFPELLDVAKNTIFP